MAFRIKIEIKEREVKYTKLTVSISAKGNPGPRPTDPGLREAFPVMYCFRGFNYFTQGNKAVFIDAFPCVISIKLKSDKKKLWSYEKDKWCTLFGSDTTGGWMQGLYAGDKRIGSLIIALINDQGMWFVDFSEKINGDALKDAFLHNKNLRIRFPDLQVPGYLVAFMNDGELERYNFAPYRDNDGAIEFIFKIPEGKMSWKDTPDYIDPTFLKKRREERIITARVVS